MEKLTQLRYNRKCIWFILGAVSLILIIQTIATDRILLQHQERKKVKPTGDVKQYGLQHQEIKKVKPTENVNQYGLQHQERKKVKPTGDVKQYGLQHQEIKKVKPTENVNQYGLQHQEIKKAKPTENVNQYGLNHQERKKVKPAVNVKQHRLNHRKRKKGKRAENVKQHRSLSSDMYLTIEAAYPPLDAKDMKNSTVKLRLAEYIDENKASEMRKKLLKVGFTPYLITLTPYNDGFKQNQNMRRRPDGTNSIPLQGTCAVVGSAGILQNSGCGHDIDGHDFIFRGNLAKTIGFEQDVGTKTDLMVLNGAASLQSSICLTNYSASCHNTVYETFDELNDTYLWISKLDISKNISYAHDLVAGIKKNNLRVKIVYPYKALLGSIARFWKIRNPSLGLIMYTAAASLCRRVSLYGFYPFYKLPNGEPLKHHYYDNRSLNYTTHHHMPEEFKMFESLNKNRIIRLVTDKCRLVD